MRSGVCALQQTLTAEAASVLKHSLGLARRRGHAQVTPLHVAATLLSLRGSSLRRACLKSQPHQTSHPLQCRALELCFNVALNRLPTTPAPLIHTQPSLSNALIAALKRAQAHQRRGCIEQQQQQPLLTIKVEMEQLIISILDDPSVSRVMREAGFSSAAVKNNIEDSSPHSVFQSYNSSGGVFSSPCSPSASESHREITTNPTNFRQTHHFLASYASEFHPSLVFSPPKNAPVCSITGAASSSKDDIRLVLDILLRKKKKNTVIVGDSVSLTEGLVGELMGKLERSEVPDELKSTHFIKFQFSPVSLSNMKRDEVEMKLLELKRKVDSIASGGGSGIFYIGDLKWTVEEATFSEKEEGSPDEEVSGYNPVDHLVSEIGKLFCDCGTSNNAKVWLMATASYQTYMRCQMRQPPLEKQWALQAVPVPSGGLGLSLHAPSVLDSKTTISQNQFHVPETKPFGNMEQQDTLNCCEECASNYEKEAQFLRPNHKKILPFWLQSHSTEDHKKDELVQLKRKWNRLCHCLHQSKQPQNQWNWNNSYDSPSSISFANSSTYGSSSKLVPRFRRQQSCITEFNFGNKREATEPVLDSLESMEGKEVKTTLALGNGGSGETVGDITDTTLQRAHICKLLQENVPWQSETVPSIAEALIDCKSAKQSNNITWLLVQGNDTIGKRRLALAVAESVFGATDVLLHFDMLKRETSIAPFSEMLAGALKTHQQLVMLIENVDFTDAQFKKFLSDGFETGKFGNSTEENSSQVIFILTSGGSTSIEEKNEELVMRLLWQVSETKPNLETPTPTVATGIAAPCLGHKRRAELDLFSNIKSFQGSKKKEFSRQTSFNTLDLNMKADEEDKAGESSPISSDLTRETIADPLKPNGFFDSIKNRFEFNTSPVRDREMAELFLCKIKGSFEEVNGKQCLENLSVDERVIEDVRVGCGFFTNSLFEKWLKDVFQSSLQTVNFGGKEGILFRLSWGGKGDRKLDSGFMSTSLPKCIQVNYFIE
ncbi:Chaperone protein ClpB1 [Spatholobus suberectus]|nr:Chaperone protein ClpB1 [Spatholobus suberectus]